MKSQRYFLDALYGRVVPPQAWWPILLSPEVQRLRDIRMCNINSLCLPGGANISRFEHSIGTAHLAEVCFANWPAECDPPSESEVGDFQAAALLHDAMSGPFGHSFEYVAGGKGFDHESAFAGFQLGTDGPTYQYRRHALEGLIAGSRSRLRDVLKDDKLGRVGRLIAGDGRLGPLMSGDIDLDNIDNVFRMAHHMGLRPRPLAAEELAASLRVDASGALVGDARTIALVDEWQSTRRRVYEYLLLNPEEFSAKCMLTEAVETAMEHAPTLLTWRDTDADLLRKLTGPAWEFDRPAVDSSARLWRDSDSQLLHKLSSPYSGGFIATSNAQRLMVGDLFGCAGLYTTSCVTACREAMSPPRRRDVEESLGIRLKEWAKDNRVKRLGSVMVALHFIVDVNKTDRVVDLRVAGHPVRIGTRSDCAHIGVFFRNRGLGMTETARLVKRHGLASVIEGFLRDRLGLEDISTRVLYSEGD